MAVHDFIRALLLAQRDVIANPQFGFTVSTDGSGFTWSVNSQQNQLTPWSNDPTGDPPGEAIYLRDEETGDVWGPTALPIRQKLATYSVRHGQGYSKFEHESHGIGLELLQYVPVGLDKNRAHEDRQSVRTGTTAIGYRLCRMGSGPEPGDNRTVHRHGNRCRDWRNVRA